jgi:uncharacterized protein YbjT (DUF2867 family)
MFLVTGATGNVGAAVVQAGVDRVVQAGVDRVVLLSGSGLPRTPAPSGSSRRVGFRQPKSMPAAISPAMIAATTQSTTMQKGGHHRVLAT